MAVLTTLATVRTEVRRRLGETTAANSFWTDAEIDSWINIGELVIARDTKCLEGVFTQNTVSGTSNYVFDATMYKIKVEGDRAAVFFDSEPLAYQDMTWELENVAEDGDPQWFWEWNRSLYVYPIPARAAELKMYCYKLPSGMSADTDTVSIPNEYRMGIVDYAVKRALLKDENYNAGDRAQAEYMVNVRDVKKETASVLEQRPRYVHMLPDDYDVYYD